MLRLVACSTHFPLSVDQPSSFVCSTYSSIIFSFQTAKSRLPEVDFEGLMKSPQGTLTWLQQISTFGVSLVKRAPLHENVVFDLGNRISAVQVHCSHGVMLLTILLNIEYRFVRCLHCSTDRLRRVCHHAFRSVFMLFMLYQKTIYDETFDVVSTKNPVNIAYTPLELEVHTDLAYYESPPGTRWAYLLILG